LAGPVATRSAACGACSESIATTSRRAGSRGPRSWARTSGRKSLMPRSRGLWPPRFER